MRVIPVAGCSFNKTSKSWNVVPCDVRTNTAGVGRKSSSMLLSDTERFVSVSVTVSEPAWSTVPHPLSDQMRPPLTGKASAPCAAAGLPAAVSTMVAGVPFPPVP